MKINHIKLISIFTISMAIIVIFTFQSNVTKVSADNEIETYYKKTCMMCHTANATKAFDATKADADLEKTILEGKDAKPLKMPEYKSKGVDEAKAKELVAYMKSKANAAKPPANTATSQR